MSDFFPYQGYLSGYFAAGGSVIPARLKRSYEILFSRLGTEIRPEQAFAYLQKNLGIESAEKLKRMLTVEQADSVLLAARALQAGRSFTVADKTGLGKGRILASLLRVALVNKKKVVFISEKANLFQDFWRDLFDVEAQELLMPNKVLMLSGSKTEIYRDGVLFAKTPSLSEQKRLVEQHAMPFDCIMTTYSQLSGNAGAARLEYLTDFAAHAYILFDEFHNAVGAAATVKNILEAQALGAVHSTATMMNKALHLPNFYPELNLDPQRTPDFARHLSGFEEIYADSVGEAMIRSGVMLRREHAYSMKQEQLCLDKETESKIEQLLYDFGCYISDILRCRDFILEGCVLIMC